MADSACLQLPSGSLLFAPQPAPGSSRNRARVPAGSDEPADSVLSGPVNLNLHRHVSCVSSDSPHLTTAHQATLLRFVRPVRFGQRSFLSHVRADNGVLCIPNPAFTTGGGYQHGHIKLHLTARPRTSHNLDPARSPVAKDTGAPPDEGGVCDRIEHPYVGLRDINNSSLCTGSYVNTQCRDGCRVDHPRCARASLLNNEDAPGTRDNAMPTQGQSASVLIRPRRFRKHRIGDERSPHVLAARSLRRKQDDP